MKYQKLNEKERFERSNQIFGVFFNKESIYEIKITNELLNEIKKEKEFSKINLFDKILKSLLDNEISDLYKRFCFTFAYDQMIEKKKKKSLYLLFE